MKVKLKDGGASNSRAGNDEQKKQKSVKNVIVVKRKKKAYIMVKADLVVSGGWIYWTQVQHWMTLVVAILLVGKVQSPWETWANELTFLRGENVNLFSWYN